MKKITDLFYLNSALYHVDYEAKAPLFEKYLVKELKEVPSTEEEYDAFVNAFLERLHANGYDTEERESDQYPEYLRAFSDGFYITKSEYLKHLTVYEPYLEGESYIVEMDAHMEEMTYNADMLYSPDGKYILIGSEKDVNWKVLFVEE